MVGGCFHCPECKLYTLVWLAMLSCCYSPMATMPPQKERAELHSQSWPEGFPCQNTPFSYLRAVKPPHKKSFTGFTCKLLNTSLDCSCGPVRRQTVTNHIHHILVVSLCKQTSHTDLTPYPGSSSGKVIHPQQRQPSVLGQELHKWKSFSQTSIGSLVLSMQQQ